MSAGTPNPATARYSRFITWWRLRPGPNGAASTTIRSTSERSVKSPRPRDPNRITCSGSLAPRTATGVFRRRSWNERTLAGVSALFR